jgi:hypothetical protein
LKGVAEAYKHYTMKIFHHKEHFTVS